MQTQTLFITGPAGKLEIMLPSQAPLPLAPIGIICHPHPLYSGTMHNKVVTTIARAWNDVACYPIRFNFRGIGDSEGGYGEAKGEADDTRAVIDWARQQWPNHPLWLAGFSFGAYVVLLAAQDYPVELLITVAPAVNHENFKNLRVNCRWLVIGAGQDTIVPLNGIEQWVAGLQPAPEFITLPEASHFFDGQLLTLREIIMKFSAC